ncbi:MAG: serine/threonine-protein kinase, partial [Myxococcota bacterium]
MQDPTDTDPRIGTQLGDYVVVARVADGAMGRVYEGRHAETRARVAIKVLHAEVMKDDVAVERFRREYDAAEELDHPGVIDVLDFGAATDGAPYMTMEYLEGEELSEALKHAGTFAPARTVRAVSQLAAALDAAHSFGFIHRDLKPENIFLVRTEQGDRVKILDFGSVKLQMETGPKLTAFGTTLGSPYYMSPEQAMGKLDIDQRTDVFAIAAIAYEMATGNVAFEGSNVAEILMKIMNADPPPPSGINAAYPHAFDDVIDRALSKDKTGRPGTVGALADAIAGAFGLEASHRRWAEASLAEIDAALAGATPPEPVPFGGSAPAAPVAHAAPASVAPARSKLTLVIGAVVLA